jgi:hypothetical protein
MATPPIIIGDDGSPPFVRNQAMRVGRKDEDMDQLTSANGSHPVKSASEIIEVVIIHPPELAKSFVDVDRVEVRGNLGTSITVEVDTDLVVTTSGNLQRESETGFGHLYAADDATIIEVLIDGKTTGYDPAIGRGHVDITVA